MSPEKPFTWASGLKSPIYCDNRLTLGYPDIRNEIARAFEEIITKHSLDADVLAGTATAGIPHAAILATKLDKPMCYVRSSAKKHGRKNTIEGPVSTGDRVIVIEDLISTGMSSLKAVDALVGAGAEVQAVLAIFSYGFDSAARAFQDAGVPHFTITGYGDLLEVARDRGELETESIELLKSWRSDPESWGV